MHLHHFPLAGAHLLHDGADGFFRHIDEQALYRLIGFAVDLLIQHLGRADGKFIPFAAHGFYEDGKVHFAAACHAEGIGGIAVLHAQGYVLEQFAEQAVPYLAGGHIFSLFAGKRAVVDGKGHLYGGLLYLDKAQRFRRVYGGYGIADGDVRNAGEADDIAYRCAFGGHAL